MWPGSTKDKLEEVMQAYVDAARFWDLALRGREHYMPEGHGFIEVKDLEQFSKYGPFDSGGYDERFVKFSEVSVFWAWASKRMKDI